MVWGAPNAHGERAVLPWTAPAPPIKAGKGTRCATRPPCPIDGCAGEGKAGTGSGTGKYYYTCTACAVRWAQVAPRFLTEGADPKITWPKPKEPKPAAADGADADEPPKPKKIRLDIVDPTAECEGCRRERLGLSSSSDPTSRLNVHTCAKGRPLTLAKIAATHAARAARKAAKHDAREISQRDRELAIVAAGVPKPPGRPPAGYWWDSERGVWVNYADGHEHAPGDPTTKPSEYKKRKKKEEAGEGAPKRKRGAKALPAPAADADAEVVPATVFHTEAAAPAAAEAVDVDAEDVVPDAEAEVVAVDAENVVPDAGPHGLQPSVAADADAARRRRRRRPPPPARATTTARATATSSRWSGSWRSARRRAAAAASSTW